MTKCMHLCDLYLNLVLVHSLLAFLHLFCVYTIVPESGHNMRNTYTNVDVGAITITRNIQPLCRFMLNVFFFFLACLLSTQLKNSYKHRRQHRHRQSASTESLYFVHATFIRFYYTYLTNEANGWRMAMNDSDSEIQNPIQTPSIECCVFICAQTNNKV